VVPIILLLLNAARLNVRSSAVASDVVSPCAMHKTDSVELFVIALAVNIR
jgi:hypothetical protein